MCDVCGRSHGTQVVPADEGKLFAVVNGKGATYCMAMVCTSQRYAESLCPTNGDYRVEEFDCDNKPEVATFPVYVVSVGENEKYRVVDLMLVKNLAHRFASSIKGTVSTYKAMSSTPEPSEARFYTWFIPLGPCNQDEEYYYRDSYRQRVLLYEGQELAPTITHRRRYDDGLPYRLEIRDTNQERCGNVTEQIYEQVKNERLSPDVLEYNVEYTLVFNTDKDIWEIDPCLL